MKKMVSSLLKNISGLNLICLFLITACTNKANLKAPEFTGITVSKLSEVTYDSQTTQLQVFGTNTFADALPVTTIRFYQDANCSQTLGEGLVRDFQTNGITLTVPSKKTSLYSNTVSNLGCQFVITYDPIHAPPPAPNFSAYSPTSPSSTSASPFTYGTLGGVTLTVNFYSTANCSSSLLGSGSANAFTTVGVQLSLQLSATNLVYAQAVEPFGNKSPCTPFPNYINTARLPDAPTLTQISPASPNPSALVTLTGLVDTDGQVIKFYSESTCTTQLSANSTNASDYTGSGIVITVPSNTTTQVYSRNFDSLNNGSHCVLLTSYLNNQVAPNPPQMAAVPTPTPYPDLYLPPAPSLTLNPKISGIAPTSSTATVNLYSDSSCTQALGSGSKAQFESTGITITVTPDTAHDDLTSVTQVYGKAVDYSGNSSTCVFLTQYIFDSIPPSGAPTSDANPDSHYFSDPHTYNNIRPNPSLYLSTTDDTATVAIYADDPTCSSTGNPDGSSSLVGARTLLDTEITDVFRTGGVPTNVSYGASHAPRVSDDSTACAQDHTKCRDIYEYHGHFYGVAYDKAGNSTGCQLIMSYDFSNKIPDSPVAGNPVSLPLSPSNASYHPIMKGAVDDIALNVEFFDCTGVTVDSFSVNTESSCKGGSGGAARCVSIGTGTVPQFRANQVHATVNQNAETPLYGVSFDRYGNYSYCKFFTNYIYTTVPPSPPNFTSNTNATGFDMTLSLPNNTTRLSSSLKFVPGSQNKWVTSSADPSVDPITINGTVGINPNRVVDPLQMAYNITFYNSSSCINKIGSGVVTSTETQNNVVSEASTWTYQVTASTSPSAISANNSLYIIKNSTNAIYAEVWDNAGAPTSNHSTCTFLGTIIEDERIPGVPTLLTNSLNPTMSKNLSLTGGIATNTDILAPQIITFFNNSTCDTTPSGPFPYVNTLNPDSASTVNPNLWTTSWSQLTVPGTTDLPITETIPIYGQTTNVVGTKSACQSLFSYVHDNEGAAITGLVLQTNGTVNVNWDATPNNISFPVTTYYTLLRSTQANGPYSIIASTNPSMSSNTLTTPSFNDKTTVNNATYYYTLVTSNSTGTSNYSNQFNETYVKFTGLVGNVDNKIQISGVTPPAALTGLTATPGMGQIGLSWNATSADLNYEVWRATQPGGKYTSIKKFQAPTNTYIDSGLTNNTRYYYVITAANVAGTSTFSNEASALPRNMPNDTPMKLKASWNSSNQLVLNWGTNSYYNSFDIYFSGSSGGEVASSATNSPINVAGNTYTFAASPFLPRDLGLDSAFYVQVSPRWGALNAAQTGQSGTTFSNEVVAHWVQPGLAAFAGQNKIQLRIYGTGSEPYLIIKRGTQSTIYSTSTVVSTAGLTYTAATISPVAAPGYWTYDDTTVNTTTGYFYTVIPQYDTAGDELGMPSPEASALANGATATSPTNLKLGKSTYSTSSNITLTWTPPDLYNYVIIYRCSSSSYSTCLTTANSSNWTNIYQSNLNQNISTYQDANISSGSYLYKVRSFWGGTGHDSNFAYFYNTQPGTVSTSITGTNAISVSWTAGSSAAPTGQTLTYDVNRGTSSLGPYSTVIASGLSSSTLTFSDTTATNAKSVTYYYQVTTTYKKNGTVTDSNGNSVATGTTLGNGFASVEGKNTPTATPSPASTLVAPTNLTVTATTGTSISFAFAKTLTTSANYTGYYLYYKNNTSGSCPAANNPALGSFSTSYPFSVAISSSATTATLTGLSSGSNYCFVLATYKYVPASGVTPASTTYSTTSNPTASAYTYTQPTSAPSIYLENCGTNASPTPCIGGSWNNTGAITSVGGVTYTLQRSTDATFTNSGLITNLAAYTGATPTFPANFIDTTATSVGTLYFYRMLVNYPFSYAPATQSFTYATAASNGLSANNLPSPPKGLSATQNSAGTTITINWTPSSSAKGYNLYLVSGTSVLADGSNLAIPSPSPSLTTPITPLITTNTYSLTGTNITLNTPVTVAVSALNDNLESTFTNLPLLTVYPLAAPAAPSVTTQYNTNIVITWPQVSGAVSYTLERATNQNSSLLNFTALTTQNDQGSTNTYTDTTGVPGQTYYYRFMPNFLVNGSTLISNYSAVSNSITPGSATNANTTATLASNVQVDTSTPGSNIITWNAVANSPGYNVYRSTSNTGIVSTANLIAQIGIVSPATTPVTTYTDNTVAIGVTYFYRVTSGATPTGALAAPTNLTATTIIQNNGSNNSTINLSWSEVPQALGYNVYRSTTSVNLINPANILVNGGATAYPTVQIVAPLTTPANSYADTNVVNGTTYYYAVTSVNSSNVESTYDTVQFSPISAKAGLNTVNAGIAPTLSSVDTSVNNQINLTWTSISGATSYIVKRQDDYLNNPSAPYQIITTTSNLTYQDTDLKDSVPYQYMIAANLNTGALSPDSLPVAGTASAKINISIPIELTDQAIASSASQAITFERTQTSYEVGAYNGTITYDLEVFATNTNSSNNYNVSLVDSTGNVKATQAIDSGTNTPKRFFKQGISLNNSDDVYRLKLDQTSSDGQLTLYSARLWVNQTGATKTKIYIPLISTADTSQAGNDITAPIFSTQNNTTYQISPAASIYTKQLSSYYENAYQRLDIDNPWELEAIVASSGKIGENATIGSIALLDTSNANAVIYDSETQFSGSELTSSTTNPNTSATPIPISGGFAMQPTLTNISFLDNASNFYNTASHSFQLALKCELNCGTNSVSLYKAGLWITLTDLNQVNVYLRTSLGGSNILTSIDSSKYSHALYFFQTTTNLSNGSGMLVNLMDNGTSDTLGGSTSNLTALTPTNTTALTPAQTLSGDITSSITSQNRIFTNTTNASMGDALIDSGVVIQVNRTP